MARWGFAPFAVNAYDNPETIRMRKYVTGRALCPAGTGVETGRTSREFVWEKGKARLYRYGTGVEKRFAVTVLLVYALILRPYILDLVSNRIAHLLNLLNFCTSRSDRYRRQNRTAEGERSRDRPALGA
jgi:hypothetical protein